MRFGYRERDTERQRERFVVLSPHRKRGEGERERRRGDSEPFRVNNSREKDKKRIWEFFDICSSSLQQIWIGIESATLELG